MLRHQSRLDLENMTEVAQTVKRGGGCYMMAQIRPESVTDIWAADPEPPTIDTKIGPNCNSSATDLGVIAAVAPVLLRVYQLPNVVPDSRTGQWVALRPIVSGIAPRESRALPIPAPAHTEPGPNHVDGGDGVGDG